MADGVKAAEWGGGLGLTRSVVNLRNSLVPISSRVMSLQEQSGGTPWELFVQTGVPSDAQLMEREQQQALPASKPGEPPPTTPQPPKADQGSWGAHGRDTSKVGPRKVCGYFRVSGSADGRGRGSDSVSEATALLILPSLIFSCSNLGQN